jgi:hypothetical protein
VSVPREAARHAHSVLGSLVAESGGSGAQQPETVPLRFASAGGLTSSAGYVHAGAKVVVVSQTRAANVKIVNPTEDDWGFRFAQLAAAAIPLMGRASRPPGGLQDTGFQIKAASGKQGTERDVANSGA